LYNSHDIRFRNVHVNGESGVATCDEYGCTTFLRLTKYPFENAIQDMTHGIDVREREFAVLDIPARVDPVRAETFRSARVEKLGDGFYGLGGGAVTPDGTLYFVDRRNQRIHSYSDQRGLGIVRDQPTDAVNLAADRSGNLLVLASAGRNGTVYSFRPGSPDDQVSLVPSLPATARQGVAVAVPVNWWTNGEFKDQIDPATYRFTTLAEMFRRDVAEPRPREHVSPDGSLVMPAYRVIQQGPPDFRAMRFSHALDAYGFTTAAPGERVFVTNASENRTYSALVEQGGALTDLRVFADRGGEGVAADASGRVFVANGQVFVYAKDGKEIGRIDLPERPIQLLFGGPKRDTLFALSQHSLYAIRWP
jgi:DNA-binding beta-propeller fold protein YncE